MRSGLPVTHTGVGPDGQAFVALAPAATGGIRTRLVPASDCPQAVGAVSRIDHLGIASEDIDANVRIFVDALGCPLESSETDIELRHVTESFVSDKYGAVYRSRPTEILGGLRGVFVTVGDCELEIMMDYDPQLQPLTDLGHAQGNTKGDQSAIANFIARRGPGLVHVAFRTNDIDAMMAKLGAEGWRVIDQSGRPGGRASRIAFVHPSNFGGGVLLHFVEPHASEPRASE